MHKVPNKCSPVEGVWLFFKIPDRMFLHRRGLLSFGVWAEGRSASPPVGKSGGRGVGQGDPATFQPRQDSYKQTRTFSPRTGGCVGVWVVLC